MKNLISYLNKSSTASILAVFWSLMAALLMFYMASGKAKAHDTIQTQILQGVFGLIMLIAGFYWGSSQKKGLDIHKNDHININEK